MTSFLSWYTISVKKNNFYPYLILIACCGLIAATFGFINTQGLYLDSMASDLNVGRGTLSLYITINFLVTAILAPTFATKLRDKYNIKIVLAISGSIILAFYLLVPQFHNVYLFYLFGFVLGVTTAIFGNTMVVPLLTGWFEKAGTAIGISLAFSGVFSMIYSPIAVNLIENYGWRKAYYSYALIFFIVMLYSIIVISKKDDKVLVQKKEKSPLNKELIILMGFYIGGCMITSFANYMFSYAVSIGLTSSQASYLVSAVSFGNLILKILFGILIDHFGGIKTAFINCLIIFIGLIGMLFANSSMYILLIIFAFCIGASYASANVVSQAICADLFGKENVGKTYATLSVADVVSAFGATIFGSIYDLTGSYYYALIIFLIIFLIGVAALLIDYKLIQKDSTTSLK